MEADSSRPQHPVKGDPGPAPSVPPGPPSFLTSFLSVLGALWSLVSFGFINKIFLAPMVDVTFTGCVGRLGLYLPLAVWGDGPPQPAPALGGVVSSNLLGRCAWGSLLPRDLHSAAEVGTAVGVGSVLLREPGPQARGEIPAPGSQPWGEPSGRATRRIPDPGPEQPGQVVLSHHLHQQ